MLNLFFKNPDGTFSAVSAAEPLPVTGGGTTNGALETTQTAVLAKLTEIQADTSDVTVVVRAAEYETVAASQTDQILGATGAIGNKLKALLVIPSATTVGAISIEDGSTNTTVYAGGTVGADLKPFVIPLFDIAATTSTGWEVTTGVGASVIAFGDFT